MPYNYEYEKKNLFSTPAGVRTFIKIRDHVMSIIRTSGAIRMEEAVKFPGLEINDSWGLFACVDQMVELGELKEVTDYPDDCVGQHRVFVPRGF